jgi:hypothetical protein
LVLKQLLFFLLDWGSIGCFLLPRSLIMLWSIVYLQKKAKDFRKSEAQGNVKVESYLANAEESLPKKKKHKSK